MVGVPDSVMRMAEVAEDVMAVAGVNVTVAVVATPLAWEPRVTAGPVIKFNMAGKEPVAEASSIAAPSLVVAARTSALTPCAVAGFVNCAKCKTTSVPKAKFPPAVMAIKIFMTCWLGAASMEGVQVAPASDVT